MGEEVVALKYKDITIHHVYSRSGFPLKFWYSTEKQGLFDVRELAKRLNMRADVLMEMHINVFLAGVDAGLLE